MRNRRMANDRTPALTTHTDLAPTSWVIRGILGGALAMIGFAAIGIYQGTLAQSTGRIAREHGLDLPPSASNPECRGDAWRMVLDRGASSTFEMARKDLTTFVSKLKILGCRPSIPGNDIYQVSAPWVSKCPLASYECASPTGDCLDVQIFPIDCKRVGVRLYTDWN
ncbi:MAG: hypothetical protein QM755_08810 [Luteolibacter sp.]